MDAWEIANETPVQKPSFKPEIKIELNLEQKELILRRWNATDRDPPSIPELLEIACPGENLDGRSKQATLIKELLVSNGAAKEEFVKKNLPRQFELTEEHKEYIKNNHMDMRAIEMARFLFNNERLFPGSIEVKKINEYLRTIISIPKDEESDIEYVAPNTLDRTVNRIKRYVDEVRRDENWDMKKLGPRRKKQAEALMSYLHSFRFKYHIDNYENENDKVLFESSFVKYCFDKDDLSQENVDQYILLCCEIVIDSNIQQTINMLQREQDKTLNSDGKVSMALVEAIRTARQEHNECVKKQQALYKSLTQERSDKLNDEIKDKASLLNFFNIWKNYDSRQKILKMREKQKQNLRKELHEIEEMSELKMRCLGLSIDHIVEG